MMMGGLALLTPCVFPMIPITVSYFTKREAVSRQKALTDAALYSLGIVLTFTVLGFALTFLFGLGGINRLAASPIVNLGIAAIFLVFALSLLGALEIRLPSSWTTRLDKQASATGGVIGILLMALTFSLVSFTCTVPFVGTLMVAAVQGDFLWSLMGITAFAAVFATPFFLLALFPSWLQALPRSGGWMDSVKITMGFLELAAALKFLSNVDLVYQWELITRPVFITIWLSIALVTCFYLLGWFRFVHERPNQPLGVVRTLSVIFFGAVAFHLLRGLFGFPLGELDAFLPPRDYGNPSSLAVMGGKGESDEPEWLTDYQVALQTAQLENRPVFIDFTGYTCTNCRWMESNVFPLPEVRTRLAQFVLVRLYTDGPELEHEENLRFEEERFGTIALPYYAVMSPQNEIVTTFPGLTREVGEFVAFLDKGLMRIEEGQPTKMSDGVGRAR
jgi:thiol:disulfide interchange protein DsbD